MYDKDIAIPGPRRNTNDWCIIGSKNRAIIFENKSSSVRKISMNSYTGTNMLNVSISYVSIKIFYLQFIHGKQVREHLN